MKKLIILLILSLSLSSIYGNEPLWTEKERLSKRDILLEGEVQKIKKSHELKKYKVEEVWVADIKVSAVHKGSDKLKEQTIPVFFKRGRIIEGSKKRHKRCPRYANLKKGMTAKFFIIKCSEAHMEVLEIDANSKGGLFIEMGSDVIKIVSKKQKKDSAVTNISNNLNKTTEEIEADKELTKIIGKASTFIHKHKLQKRYYLKRPWGVYEYKNKWEVWFRKLNEDGTPFSGKPFRCCVVIEKKPGKIYFMPLK